MWQKTPAQARAASVRVGILTYTVSFVGTLDKYKVTMAAVVDIQKRCVLGFPPRHYEPIGNAPKTIQPHWNWEGSRLVIRDREFAEDFEYGDR